MQKITPAAQTFIKNIMRDNSLHIEEINHEHIASFGADPAPWATVLMCSDSRVQKTAFEAGESHGLFMIRNIGNQVLTSAGSIEYGVRQLKTPVLLIIGHSACGAITSSMSDYSHLPARVQSELDTVNPTHSKSVAVSVVENVHYQVAKAMQIFSDLINSSSLVVVGAIYDFRNNFGYGCGRLIIVDINGEKESKNMFDMIGLTDNDGYQMGLDEKDLRAVED